MDAECVNLVEIFWELKRDEKRLFLTVGEMLTIRGKWQEEGKMSMRRN
jgi:hypothetical protein